ncbi:hypothetical protein AB6N23_07890 [Cellulomonas sp. 179-A 9B4 NHS]|uniref:lipase/acyltransferase domain-containing protein n=1 Tax=Cellulomonas sp. 179-A 9B4 NHS TaxID=3142379 RepID=UPI00399EF7B2
MSDIYVLIPGIMGSVLEKDGRDAFGLTASAGLRALFSGGRSIQSLRLEPGLEGQPDDGVVASRLAEDAHLIPGFWKIDGYSRVASYLQKRLRAVPGRTFFELPYDWRLDNRVAARHLQERVAMWLTAQRAEHPDAKVVLVAHSMGGLVAKYFLEVLGGWRDTRALVTFGTPYRGSLNALDTLSNGVSKAFGLVDLTDLVRSFPSIHQLLPIYPCVEVDGMTLRLTELDAPLPGLDPGAVAAARRFHQEIEDAVRINNTLGEYATARYRTHRVIGTEHPTTESAALTGSVVTMRRSHVLGTHGGDGTVPRVSASPLELDDDEGAMFAGTRHSSLQNADAVLTQLKGWMTTADLRGFRAGGQVRLSLDLDDVHPTDAGVAFTVTPSSTPSSGRPTPPTEPATSRRRACRRASTA